MSFEALMDRIDAKMMANRRPEKEVLSAEEYSILIVWNFAVSVGDTGIYEYIYNENPDLFQDIVAGLRIVEAVDMANLVADYLANDKEHYEQVYAGEVKFGPSRDYEAEIAAIVRNDGDDLELYFRNLLEEFARSKGMM
ncbi:hypothetical protein [Porphyrobacter sp. YT40]|uniref:DMP19 family protein n=1 Tax=Porphyrobacter sp. YT40 TaxID=2547601 RepID=UPI001143E2D1|nr:hypothetical protein [Porphyrobacter sp. YT40]QDH35195.1 hypothetical protein E2E27_13215 [Porphyrobacter sp. YT40]